MIRKSAYIMMVALMVSSLGCGHKGPPKPPPDKKPPVLAGEAKPPAVDTKPPSADTKPPAKE